MKFNWREGQGYYTPNYPPHGDATVITDGDTKKNIKNRERKERGKPDSNSRGSEFGRDYYKEDLAREKQTRIDKAQELDQRDEDLSDFREDQHRVQEDIAENKKDPYTEGDGGPAEFEEAMKEMDIDWYDRHGEQEKADALRRELDIEHQVEQAAELEASGELEEDPELVAWRKELNFRQAQSGGAKSATAGNKAKFYTK